MALNRRNFIQGGTTVLGALAIFPARAEVVVAGDKMEQYARFRGGVRPAPAIWWATGVLWGRAGGDRARILMRVELLQAVHVAREGDRWREVVREAVFWGDPEQGAPMSEWRNPFTDANLPPPPPFQRTRQFDYTLTGRLMPTEGLPASGGGISPVTGIGDDVWVAQAIVGLCLPEPRRKECGSMLSITFRCNDDALRRGPSRFVPANLSLQSLDPWPEFLAMDERPGHVMVQAHGSKLRRVVDAPVQLRRRIEQDFPQWIKESFE